MGVTQEKKGGPYNKNEKIKRQNEVFKLHFERGYSAVKISDMMKINRNTINNDISYWYGVLAKEWDRYDIDSWSMKQVHRLELQRNRLLKELDRVEMISARLSIEKMIFDIDSKIMSFVSKIIFTQNTIRTQAADMINRWAKSEKMETSFIDSKQFLETSRETADKIYKLMNEDRKKLMRNA